MARGQQVDGRALVQDADVGVGGHGLDQAVLDGPPGVVGAGQDALHAVAALAGQVPVPGLGMVEGHLHPLEEDFFDGPRAVLAEESHSGFVVVLPSGRGDVPSQLVGRVIGAGVDDAALGQGGVAAVQSGAGGEQGHFAALIGQAEGGGAASDA